MKVILRTARPFRVALIVPMFAVLLTFQYSGTGCAPFKGNSETQSHSGALPSDVAREGRSGDPGILFQRAGLVAPSKPQSAAPSYAASVDDSSPINEVVQLKLPPHTSDSDHVSSSVLAERGDMSGSSASKDEQPDDCSLPNCARGSSFEARNNDAFVLEETSAGSPVGLGVDLSSIICPPSSVAHPTAEPHSDCADLDSSNLPVSVNPVFVVIPLDSPPSVPVAPNHDGADAGHDVRFMPRCSRRCQSLSRTGLHATVAVGFLFALLFTFALPGPLRLKLGFPLLTAMLITFINCAPLGGTAEVQG